MWQREVQCRVNCYIADIDEMLQPVHPLLVALRYLALLYKGQQQDAMDIYTMKKGRKRTEQDLERPYYKHMLKIFQVHGRHQRHVTMCCQLPHIAAWIALSPVVPFGVPLHPTASPMLLLGAFASKPCNTGTTWLSGCAGSCSRSA